MYCSECGKYTDRNYSGMCQGCYKYFKAGGKVYPLPEAGRIEYDTEGKVICHICGRSYKRLGSHIKESHHMTISEYKEKFGLCARTKTTELSYSIKMRNLAIKNNMDKNIVKWGTATRIKQGDGSLRCHKKARLQEIIDKQNRKLN